MPKSKENKKKTQGLIKFQSTISKAQTVLSGVDQIVSAFIPKEEKSEVPEVPKQEKKTSNLIYLFGFGIILFIVLKNVK